MTNEALQVAQRAYDAMEHPDYWADDEDRCVHDCSCCTEDEKAECAARESFDGGPDCVDTRTLAADGWVMFQDMP